MENQNKEEITKFLKENDEMFKFIKDINQAFGSSDSLVKLMEGIDGKKMTADQKQTLSKMTGLSPITAGLITDTHCGDTDVGQGRGVAYPREMAFNPYDNGYDHITTSEETSWLFSFNFVDEVGDVFFVLTDKDSKEWVGFRWTPVGVVVYNKNHSYMERYNSGYRINSPGIMAFVSFNFSGSTVPFRAQVGFCLIENEDQYRLLGTMKIDGVTIETPLIHTHLGMIHQSPVLTNLLNRLEVQKQRQSTQPKKEATVMENKDKQEKVEAVPMVKIKMTGDVTAGRGLIVTVTNDLNNKMSTINWYTNCVQVIDSSLDSMSTIVPINPVVAKKPNGIDSHNQELKCVYVNVMLSIYSDSLTNAKVYLAMTGEKFHRKLVGFITIGDETIIMPEVPLTPRMIAEVQILQTLLTTLTDHPEQELPDTETKAPCFTPPTPNPIPQPIFNPYGSHPSQQFTQQPSFAPYTPNPIPQQPYGQHPSFGHTPYPPQQPHGHDITLMRIMEQLYSLSEKVDLLLRKQ